MQMQRARRCERMVSRMDESKEIPRGECIRIDRKTGEVLQFEVVTPESMARAARTMAQVLVDDLLKKAQKEGIA